MINKCLVDVFHIEKLMEHDNDDNENDIENAKVVHIHTLTHTQPKWVPLSPNAIINDKRHAVAYTCARTVAQDTRVTFEDAGLFGTEKIEPRKTEREGSHRRGV